MAPLPMFPLGTVLLPGAILPLHVFEPRYRALVQDCLASTRELGVVLIERGSEVGGGDVRSDVGTVARIAQAQELEDGRWAVLAVGLRRVRVEAWLPEDPYPRAEVADWPEGAPTGEDGPELAPVVARLRRVLARAAEVGDLAAPATVELSDELVLGGYQACAAAPVGPHDQRRLLEAATPTARLALLDQLLVEADEVLGLRLAEG
jgi:Lon protease-like protein